MQEGFIDNLRQFFEQKDITQKKIADELGVSPAYINKLLTGQKAFGKKTAQQFQDLFGLSASWLLTGTGSMLKDADPPPEVSDGDVQRLIRVVESQQEALRVQQHMTQQLIDMMQRQQERGAGFGAEEARRAGA